MQCSCQSSQCYYKKEHSIPNTEVGKKEGGRVSVSSSNFENVKKRYVAHLSKQK